MNVLSEATHQKRQQLTSFIDKFLKPEPTLHAVVGVGSIAFGTMRPDSDIDAVLFWDPIDYYVVPSEFVWVPEANTYHSIFEPDVEGIQFDLHHFDLRDQARDESGQGHAVFVATNYNKMKETHP